MAKDGPRRRGDVAKEHWSIGTIVVGTDFSPASRAALRTAAAIAEAHGSALVLAHVVPEDRVPYLVPHKRTSQEALARARSQLDRLAAAFHKRGIAANGVAVGGRPWSALIGVARDVRADLVIVGTRGLGAVGRFFFGSTADRLVRAAPMPVLVARGREVRLKRFYSAVDFSPCSARALTFATALAGPLGAQVTAVHAVEDIHLAEEMSLAAAARNRLRRDATNALEAFAGEYAVGQGRLPIKVRVIESPPVESLILTADRRQADLLVLGSVGRSGVEGLIVGNTAEKVLKRTKLPVLVVKPPT